MNKKKIDSIMQTALRPEITMVTGRGSWLTDSNGNRYLDFVQGWAVNCLGHCPPNIVAALSTQASTLINSSPAFYNDQMVGLAAQLTTLSGLDRVFFCNSGAEANEGAIKLVRKWGQKYKNGAYKIITFENSFHGRTLATMSASGKPNWDHLFEPKVPGFIKTPFNKLHEIEGLIDNDCAAIMLELVQGEGGVVPARQDFANGIIELGKKYNLLVVIDEVQTGIGRSGSMFCFQRYNLAPDIVTLGKGIGGGVPLAALLCKESVSVFDPGDQGGTYNGNPLMSAVGAAVVGTVSSPTFLAKVSETASYFVQALQSVSDEFGLSGTRGVGLLQALLLNSNNAPDIAALAIQRGLLINAPQPSVLRFMPALNVLTDEIDEMISILRGIFTDLRQ